MQSVRVILKSGREFTVKCGSFTVIRDDSGVMTGYNIEGIIANSPIYLDFSQVDAFVDEMSDEPACVVSELSIAG